MKKSTLLAGLSLAVCLTGATWLLLFGWQPDKSADPVPILAGAAAEAEAATHAERLGAGGRAFIVSPTGSMRPLLQGGDYVVTQSDYASARVGQVFAYWPTFATRSGHPLIHRAVQKDKDGWIMSGDSAPHTESWARVTEANYIGTLVAIYRPL